MGTGHLRQQESQIMVDDQANAMGGAEVSIATVEGLRLIAGGVPPINLDFQEDPAMIGTFGKPPQFRGSPHTPFSLEFYLPFEGEDPHRLLVCGMGDNITPVQIVDTAYYNDYKVELQSLCKFFTLAEKVGIVDAVNLAEGVRKINSAFVKDFIFEVMDDTSGLVKVTVNCIGDTEILDSALTTAASFNGLTYASALASGIMRRSLGVFRLNSNDGAALDSDDAIKILGLKLTHSSSLRNDGVEFASGGQYVSDPIRDDAWNTTLEVKLQSLTDHAWLAEHKTLSLSDYLSAGDLYKADMTFTGEQIAATGEFFLNQLQLPRLQFKEITNGYGTGARGAVTPTLMFDVLESNGPTGMTAVTGPFWMRVQNTITAAL